MKPRPSAGAFAFPLPVHVWCYGEGWLGDQGSTMVGSMPGITDAQIDFIIISFLRQEEATAAWLANRIGITRDQTSRRLRSLQRKGMVTFNRVAWRYNGSGVPRTKTVTRL